MKSTSRLLTCVAAAMFLSSTAHAAGEQGGQGGGLRQACGDDVRSFCQGIQPGGGRIINCLEDHYKEISDACYTALKNSPAAHGGHQGGAPAAPGGDEGDSK